MSLPENSSRNVVLPPRSGLRTLASHQELFHHVLGYLPIGDLVTVEAVSKDWRRGALDGQLWKRLYLHANPTSYQTPLSTPQRHSHRNSVFPPFSPALPELRSTGPILDQGSVTSSSSLDPFVTPHHRSEPIDSPYTSTPDWKRLVRISTNWQTGNARISTLTGSSSANEGSSSIHKDTRVVNVDEPEQVDSVAVEPESSSTIPSAVPKAKQAFRPIVTAKDTSPPGRETIIALCPSYIFIAHPHSPLLHVHNSDNSHISQSDSDVGSSENKALALIPPPPGWSNPKREDYISAICVDQASGSNISHPNERDTQIAVFYESGGFVILRLSSSSFSSTSKLVWNRLAISEPPPHRRRRVRTHHIAEHGDAVVLARLDGELVVGVTRRWLIGVWRFRAEIPSTQPVTPVLLKTFRSDVSSWPATLHLSHFLPVLTDSETVVSDDGESTLPEDSHFRISLGYCTPIYPHSWGLAIQELDVTLTAEPKTGESMDMGKVVCGECLMMKRPSRGMQRKKEGNSNKMSSWKMNEDRVVGVKGQVKGIGINGNKGALVGENSQIQIYSIPERNEFDRSRSTTTTRYLKHSHTLLPHSSISSLSLSNNRCISADINGRLLIWDLDQQALQTPISGEDHASEYVGWTDWVEIDPVEIRTEMGRPLVGYDGMKGKGKERVVSTPQRQESSSVDEDEDGDVSLLSTTTPSKAFRRTILPRPPILHPFSLVAAAQELRTPSRQKNENEGESSSVVKKFDFNEDTIVGVTGDEGMDRVEKVLIWKFDG